MTWLLHRLAVFLHTPFLIVSELQYCVWGEIVKAIVHVSDPRIRPNTLRLVLEMVVSLKRFVDDVD